MKFGRLIETYLAFAPKGFLSFAKAMPLWIKDKLFQKSILIKSYLKFLDMMLIGEKDCFSQPTCHMLLVHFSFLLIVLPSTLDGVGEWTTTSVAIGEGRNLKVEKEIKFPHSLGLLYSSFTYYVGFKVNSGEYKLMGLAPYGEPRYADTIKEKLITISDDGSFQLNMSYFDFATG